ncbi:MAG: hypothetical protein K2W99_01070 [Chthoniobacterales bacterium]|nr:hypothetical protein [Chthoniobacterales bacterium]
MALSSISDIPQSPIVSASPAPSSKGFSPENLDPKSLQHEIAIAKTEHTLVEKIATAYAENEEHGELVSMLRNMSHANLHYAEEAVKNGEYQNALTHIENVNKAATAAASYQKKESAERF